MHDVGGRRLELLQLLGSGGFGEVYLGQLHGADGFVRKVAVKCVRAGLAHRTDVSGRHRDEARLLGRLVHDHIVQCIDLAEIDGVPAMILEFVEGVNAGVLVAAAGGLPVRAAADVVEAVADALAFASSEATREDGQPLRVVHRDVKPGNVLISLRGAVKVSDFGIARADVDREGQTGAVQLGTGAYMAPESWLRLEQGPPADVFALGVTLLHLLGVSTAERWPLDRVHFDRAVAEALASAAPLAEVPELQALLSRMLAWEPVDRPDASEVRQRLAALQGQLPGESIAQVARRLVASCLQTQLGLTPSPGTPSGPALRSGSLPPWGAGGVSGQQTFALQTVDHEPVAGNAAPEPPQPPSAVPAASPASARGRRSWRVALGTIGLCALIGTTAVWRPARVAVGRLGVPVCGNGVLDGGESCDDGNGVDTDGCRNDCSPNAVWMSGVGRDGTPWRMGSDDCDGRAGAAPSGAPHPMCVHEAPAVAVTLSPFWIQRNEFTMEAALEWAGRAGRALSGEVLASRGEGAALPLRMVSFDEAQAFCRALGGDLPTEAQWEFAALGGDPKRVYPWGDAPPTCDRAVTGDHNCSHGRPDNVCSRPAGNTREGVCDMAGNVWEWTRWSFDGPVDDDILAYRAVDTDPAAARNHAWENPEAALDAPTQPLRGGGHWHTALFFNRARARYGAARGTTELNIGFRCVWRDAAFLPASEL